MIENYELSSYSAESIKPYFTSITNENVNLIRHNSTLANGIQITNSDIFSIIINQFPSNCGIVVFSDLSIRFGKDKNTLFECLEKLVYDMGFTVVMYTTLNQSRYESLHETLKSRGYKTLEEFDNHRTDNHNFIWFKSLRS
jgi:hypothetical protein